MLSGSIGSSRRLDLTILQRFSFVPFRDVLPPHLFGAAAADADCAPPGGRASCTLGCHALVGVGMSGRRHGDADDAMAPNATSPRKSLT